MFIPAYEEFVELSRQGNLIPVYREILADMETPVSAFKKLAKDDCAFLLESVEQGETLDVTLTDNTPANPNDNPKTRVTVLKIGASRAFNASILAWIAGSGVTPTFHGLWKSAVA